MAESNGKLQILGVRYRNWKDPKSNQMRTFYEADVYVPGEGAGSMNITEEQFQELSGEGFPLEAEITPRISVFKGKAEVRVGGFVF